MNQKDFTIQYLNNQLEVYLTSKEFADFKINRLMSQNKEFENPNYHKELCEFSSQRERCRYHIDEIINCIEWLKQLKILNSDNHKAA